jgi:replicative superfamily II helicase
MLRGLCIGIDLYSAPINRLSCAVADAKAIGTLFQDTLEGEVAIVTNAYATKVNILTALSELESSDPDDLVVITFSGHGTPDHRLVPVDADADPSRLAESCIALDDLAEALDRIPGSLIVILDCCFSGGFGGARVFAPTATRSAIEDRSSIEALAAGTGRLVITASGAGEPALETADFGHGLLTYHLIEALQGAEGLATGGRLSLLDVCNWTMRSVLDTAARLRETQTPTIYGSVEGLPTLPVLTPGATFAAAFPGRVRPAATADWASLEPYGVPSAALTAWANAMPGLNDLQLAAINDFGVLDDRSILAVAPTGSGKTMIGELAAMHAVASGGRSVILLPLRALVNDKYEYMTRTYGDAVRVIRATGEYGDQVGELLGGQFDVALLTYEKFESLMLGYPHVMRSVSVVVVDEVQMLSDKGRGADLELLLTLLRAGHGRLGPPQIVALSAVIGDTQGLERWIGGGLLRTTHRPVPLLEGVIMTDGSCLRQKPDGTSERVNGFVYPENYGGSQDNKPWIIPLVRRLVNEGKKVIVFRSRKGDTVGAAGYLRALGLPPADDALTLLPAGDPSASSQQLRTTLSHGVAFHNSDLDSDERLAIEQCFRDPESPLRVVVATTSLAMGVNTPAEAVIIAGLHHPFGDPYSVAEYKNMAGRAGRPGHVEAGESYIIATSSPGPDVAWNNYVLGAPGPVESQFLENDPQTLALRCLVALNGSVPELALKELLENSFAMWLRSEQGQGGWDAGQLSAAVEALVTAQLIDREPNGNLTLTELGRFAGESGVQVQSIVQVSSILRFAPPALSPADLITLCQVTTELDGVFMPSNRRSRQEQFRWPNVLQQMGVTHGLVNGLHVGGGSVLDRSKRAAACVMFASDTPLDAIERDLMQHNRNAAAAGPVRQAASRTRDVLDIVCRVCQFRGHELDETLVDDLALRLELGLPHAVLPLARVVGARLTRAQYLSLLRAGATDLEAAKALDHQQLVGLIGEQSATMLDETNASPTS